MLGVYGGRAGVARYFKGVAPVVVGGIADNLLVCHYWYLRVLNYFSDLCISVLMTCLPR